MKHSCRTLILFLAIFVQGCSPQINLNAPLNSRRPNKYEEFYTAMAGNFGDSQLCEKISNRALKQDAPDLGTRDWHVAGQRSACYFHVAVQTKNPQLCDAVQQIKTLPSNKSPISPAGCREAIEKNQRSFYLLTPDYYAISGFMTEMRYRAEDARAAKYAVTPDEGPAGDAFADWAFFYRYLLYQAPPERKQEFLKRLKALPSFND